MNPPQRNTVLIVGVLRGEAPEERSWRLVRHVRVEVVDDQQKRRAVSAGVVRVEPGERQVGHLGGATVRLGGVLAVGLEPAVQPELR